MDNYYYRIYFIYDRLEIQWGDISWEKREVIKTNVPNVLFLGLSPSFNSIIFEEYYGLLYG